MCQISTFSSLLCSQPVPVVQTAVPPTKAPTLQSGVINFSFWLVVTSQTSCTAMGYKDELSLCRISWVPTSFVHLKGGQTLKARVHMSSCNLKGQNYFLPQCPGFDWSTVNFLQGS